MSFDLETNTNEQLSSFQDRYKDIDAANAESFYMTNPNRTFDAYQSVESYGGARVDASTATSTEDEVLQAARRVTAGGNMSPLGPYGPIDMTEDARIEDAKQNMTAFFESLGVPKTSVYMLNPERDYSTPLTVVDVDAEVTSETTEWPARLTKSGDFIYTRDPNKVLAVRPADCPVMIATADTPNGKIYTMAHYAWKGAANNYVEQTADIFDTLGVDRNSLEIYLSPGAQAESYPYSNYSRDPREEYPGTDTLFTNAHEVKKEDGTISWSFNIDTPKYVYDQVIEKLGVEPSQVFCDTSDTGALESGYSSHGRSSRLKAQGESNTRDIVAAIYNANGAA